MIDISLASANDSHYSAEKPIEFQTFSRVHCGFSSLARTAPPIGDSLVLLWEFYSLWSCISVSTLKRSPFVISWCRFSLSSPKHYTIDADGLCTKLIKPKLVEGTVAAQDEFLRSKTRLYNSRDEVVAACLFNRFTRELVTVWMFSHFLLMWLTGGWSLNRKELKLHQVIGKGEFGGRLHLEKHLLIFYILHWFWATYVFENEFASNPVILLSAAFIVKLRLEFLRGSGLCGEPWPQASVMSAIRLCS